VAAHRKTTATDDKQIAKAYARGDSVVSIADAYDISSGTVRAVVLRQGGVLRPIGRPKTK
jgi:hypothetical protein